MLYLCVSRRDEIVTDATVSVSIRNRLGIDNYEFNCQIIALQVCLAIGEIIE